MFALCPLLALCFSLVSALNPRNVAPDGWRSGGVNTPDPSILLTIILPAADRSLIERTLYEVSDVDSDRYGMYLDREAASKLTLPLEATVKHVVKQLHAHGIDPAHINVRREYIDFHTSIPKAEELLNTTFSISSDEKGSHVVRTTDFSTPQWLVEHIDWIYPKHHFGLRMGSESSPGSRQSTSATTRGDTLVQNVSLSANLVERSGALLERSVEEDCHDIMTPSCLSALYKVPSPLSTNETSSSGFMAFTNLNEQHPSLTDLKSFSEDFAPWTIGADFTNTNIPERLISITNPEMRTEANLDAQYLLTFGWPVKMHSYSITNLNQPVQGEGGQHPSADHEPFLDLTDHLLYYTDGELPHTISTSYGQEEHKVPWAYREKVCQSIAMLAVRGVTMIFSSGDDGAGPCRKQDGTNKVFFPVQWPASCPYATSVGGTIHVDPEEAWPLSTGGFSEAFSRPKYQDEFLLKYLDKFGEEERNGYFNQWGRGIPDVAAQAGPHIVMKDMEQILVSGTSASAPTFAGMIARLNNARIEQGKPRLGFLNPWLYKTGYKGFTDITKGSSEGCKEVNFSWNATRGWDPVTGLGTPDYEKLYKLAVDEYEINRGWPE